MSSHIEPHPKIVKTELDRLELVERVPALQRRAVRDLPNHPCVVAYVNECAAVNLPDANLRIARHHFKAARVNYEQRCAFRLQRNIEWLDGGRFVSLSAIIEARADAKHWQKVVMKLEADKKIKQQNRRATQLARRYVVIDGHQIRVRRERERPLP